MTCAGIQMFMEKLKHLINCTGNPFINNPTIISARPKFQLLYDELGSMIKTLSLDEHQDLHEHKKINELRKRFIDAAEEAQYIVDLYLSGVHLRIEKHFPTYFKRSLNVDDVRRSFKLIEVEFMSTRSIDESAAAQISISRNSKGPKKVFDEIIVGLDRDAKVIRDKLVEDRKKVDVVSIVGMGGIGKTTLANKVINDGYIIKHHFHVRVWVNVSQSYDKRDVLIQILKSITLASLLKIHTKNKTPKSDCSQLDLEKATVSQLREMVHKHLMSQRYLIVIDDIWHIETWDNLKLFFPHNNNGSRILITSRLNEVAKHANSGGLIHLLGYLNKERSWELLCQKVFKGNECPKWSINPGMQIVENCHGLPLAVVVIAGVLAKEAWNEKFWLDIVERADSYIVGEKNGCLDTLGLSYNHLPLHLRECFLYLGGFPEDYEFEVQRLIWLWVAEGFIKANGNRSLEDIAEGYLMDLIDRNLVTVADWTKRSSGGVKFCKVHDLVRKLCLIKAKGERFIHKADKKQTDDSSILTLSSLYSNVTAPPCKSIRMFISKDINSLGIPYSCVENLRSLLSFSSFICLSDDIAKYFRSFVLLRVLDLQKCSLDKFPPSIKLLLHLRYLAIRKESTGFPSSICNLWNLQTLIYNMRYHYGHSVKLPSNISDLVNLRHLWSNNFFVLPSIKQPMNLLTISDVGLGDRVGDFHKCFPYIKELTCTAYLDKENDFKSLTSLLKLNLTAGPKGESICGKNHITFPATLKSLTLHSCYLPWSDMSTIQSLPNLRVLKLKHGAFEGSYWNTSELEFRRLKFLRLEWLNIKLWEAYSTSFPCLEQLEIMWCKNLEEIPLEIGDIPTLELIKIAKCRHFVGESIKRIQEEQHDLGNYDLQIRIFE